MSRIHQKIRRILVSEKDSIRDVMKNIDSFGLGMALVVDKKKD